MERGGAETGTDTTLEEVLGYLNFSSGSPDVRFRRHLNELYRRIESNPADAHRPWGILHSLLTDRLRELARSKESYRDPEQAQAVVSLAFNRVLTAYREFHRDLLHHQTDEELFRPFFLARVCETILQIGGPWDEADRITNAAIDKLNDFIGYRPVAVLRTPQKIEAYDKEWVAPIPLYLRGAGVSTGRYHNLILQALEILRSTDRDLLEQAWFDPELLDEIALDPRAYDFDHPVHKRPNYHFGQWDPHTLDNQGRYRRFVLQGVTLEAIWQWSREPGEVSERERLYEAGAVLVGTMVMAGAMGGQSPETHDSTITLAKLLPRIASFRDAFYDRLLARVPGHHGTRLREESAALRQPFGAVRQYLNTRLARLRATQLQHVHLAQLFARMGFPESSHRQAEIVPVASARMLCAINSLLTGGHHALDRSQVDLAAECIHQIEETLLRAIDCGALVDPWNMLGFQGQFSVFQALENSTHDHRVDVLVHLVRQIFGLYGRTIGEAAATGEREIEQSLVNAMTERAKWWDRFASQEVAGLESISGHEATESARHVAAALGAWHRAGVSAGNLAFWREHVARFNSSKSYAIVIDALLQKRDFVASRALLVQWLSQNEVIPLVEGEYSFPQLAVRWMRLLHEAPTAEDTSALVESPTVSTTVIVPEERWLLTKKLFDYLEANADTYWEVPRFEWGRGAKKRPAADNEEPDFEDDDEPKELFSAAYEDMTYRDSTADGFQGSTMETGPDPTDDQLEAESGRINQRLQFLATLARMWKLAAVRTMGQGILGAGQPSGRADALKEWVAQARSYQRDLGELLDGVEAYELTPPRGSHDSMLEYDRRRRMREALLGRIVSTWVEMTEATRHMLAGLDSRDVPSDLPDWEQLFVQTLRMLFRGDAAGVRAQFKTLRAALDELPVLYVPLSRNGRGRLMYSARSTQQMLVTLLRGLPRLGLIAEACQLITTAQAMERHRPRGEGFVTEFDRLFEDGYRAVVEAVIDAFPEDAHASSTSEHDLIDLLQTLTESLLKRWLEHSRSLRLSVLEKVNDKKRWHELETFIKTYGDDLFTMRWMNLGNLRAILHKGVDNYLRSLEDEQDLPPGLTKLIEDIGKGVSRDDAVNHLTVIIEAIIENYAEYKDYNNTTTQSDHGELLYMLLDLLRVKASYQRFAWTIKPVNLAHEVLVRRGRMAAAELWRRAVAQKTADVADWHLKRWQELTRQYGLRLPTIGDLLAERFVRALAIDRVQALVRPAIDERRRGEMHTTFNLLEQEIAEFTDHPRGAGLDVPTWLQALEEEAERILAQSGNTESIEDDDSFFPRVDIPPADVLQQVRTWDAGEGTKD